ncbi:MAG: DNA-binding protein WhiA [Firmicutes bacterium]|nr:DNA-binding protein WhiA [Bacillota bacterium]
MNYFNFTFNSSFKIYPYLSLLTFYFNNMNLTKLVKNELVRSFSSSFRSKEKAFLCAAFLWSGTVSSLHGYHLEFKVGDEDLAEEVIKCLKKYGIEAKAITHQKKRVVYVKGAEKVSDVLVVLGASKAVLALHETIVLKNVRAKANRLSNYDVSNINKTMESASAQLDAIKKLKEKGVFDTLDEKYIEAANAREQNPDASYEELSIILGISKSGLRHRLQKIVTIAL